MFNNSTKATLPSTFQKLLGNYFQSIYYQQLLQEVFYRGVAFIVLFSIKTPVYCTVATWGERDCFSKLKKNRSYSKKGIVTRKIVIFGIAFPKRNQFQRPWPKNVLKNNFFFGLNKRTWIKHMLKSFFTKNYWPTDSTIKKRKNKTPQWVFWSGKIGKFFKTTTRKTHSLYSFFVKLKI